MSEKDISKITVGKHSVSVLGLKEALARLAPDFSARSDREIGEAMIAELEKQNYIPRQARDEYGQAFTREFRKSLGQPYSEAAPEGMDIKVLGAGCDQCNRLTQLVMEALSELNIPANLEHVTDMREIVRFGVIAVPALLIDGKVVSTGSVPPKKRLVAWIKDARAGKNRD
jgi:small redox-active disulfide protein 2